MRHSAWSECSSNGSRFDRIVPENKTGSCGIIENFDRKSCSSNSWISTPSMMILPSFRANRNNAFINDDFPEPVLPIMPTYKYI